mmetsp:Transcript_2007/g.4527  ORF Transcript_2007/g.4527 Transcript_2007/m.4527 type:complete len:80 (+) Transcript_2007:4779-5018(+)
MEPGEQLFVIEASVNRLTATCFKVCDDNKGPNFKGLECLQYCIAEWMQAKSHVQGRWESEIKAAALHNKNIEFSSKKHV